MTDATQAARPVAPPFPEPMREKPGLDSAVWIAMPCKEYFCDCFRWSLMAGIGFSFDRGLCHTTREAAAAHGRYLASLSAKTEANGDE